MSDDDGRIVLKKHPLRSLHAPCPRCDKMVQLKLARYGVTRYTTLVARAYRTGDEGRISLQFQCPRCAYRFSLDTQPIAANQSY